MVNIVSNVDIVSHVGEQGSVGNFCNYGANCNYARGNFASTTFPTFPAEQSRPPDTAPILRYNEHAIWDPTGGLPPDKPPL